MHNMALSASVVPEMSKTYRRSRFINSTFETLLWACGLAAFLLPVAIAGYLVAEGAGAISLSFITDFPRGMPLGTKGGIMPAIEGSLGLAAIGLALALPFALGGGIYLSEYGRGQWISSVIRFLVENLAAIPAIIYGLFGYAFLVVFLKFGISLISGGIVLALIMFPIILISVQEALRSADDVCRESGLCLGVTRAYMIRRVLLPRAWPRIIAGVVLAVGHAVGSAAPVLFTASVYFSKGGLRLKEPVMTLPTHLYNLVSEAVSFEQAYGTALVLIMGLLLFNSSAMLLRRMGGSENK
ncbi:MAG: phosphate ABC transporter permease PstA [Nitrospirae bacterium]|nr:phosphate ABC transporter permease PstA [Nitrospirota bacterium]